MPSSADVPSIIAGQLVGHCFDEGPSLASCFSRMQASKQISTRDSGPCWPLARSESKHVNCPIGWPEGFSRAVVAVLQTPGATKNGADRQRRQGGLFKEETFKIAHFVSQNVQTTGGLACQLWRGMCHRPRHYRTSASDISSMLAQERRAKFPLQHCASLWVVAQADVLCGT